MLEFILSLRIVTLIASVGAAFGALLMFWEGGLRILAAAAAIVAGEDSRAVVGPVMAATDKMFFGVVLVIFAYTIMFGFAIELSTEDRRKLPAWMRVGDIDELKRTLIGVILVFLIVDFATDWSEDQTPQSWLTLVKPISILLLAGALHLLSAGHQRSKEE
jgi:uncharacterized membrane protein YqhA